MLFLSRNEKNLIWTRRLAESVDGLNSSLDQSAGELWSCKALQKSGYCGKKGAGHGRRKDFFQGGQ